MLIVLTREKLLLVAKSFATLISWRHFEVSNLTQDDEKLQNKRHKSWNIHPESTSHEIDYPVSNYVPVIPQIPPQTLLCRRLWLLRVVTRKLRFNRSAKKFDRLRLSWSCKIISEISHPLSRKFYSVREDMSENEGGHLFARQTINRVNQCVNNFN